LSEVAGTVHVIGGGAAGLAAAHALLKLGRAVTLHEGTPGAGGRARALPDGTDNGTHALIGANRAALRFLDEVGGRAGWIEPEPQGLPVLDLADGSRRLGGVVSTGLVAPGPPAGRRVATGVAALARLPLPGRT
jgi:phytoene dehydrogenase-like protein